MAEPTRHHAAGADVWNSLPELPLPSSSVSIIDQRSFCVSSASGDVGGQGATGLFHGDVRHLSTFTLRINGSVPEPVDVVTHSRREVEFILRSPTVEATAPRIEPELIIRRRRRVGPGLRDDISVSHHGPSTTHVTIDLEIDADFAHLLDIHLHASAAKAAPDVHHDDHSIELQDRSTGNGIHVSASAGMNIAGRHMNTTVALEPMEQWTVTIEVIPRSSTVSPGARRTDAGEKPRGRPQLSTSSDRLAHLWRRGIDDLDALRIDIGGHPTWAAGLPWYVALFGRDSILTSLATIWFDRQRALGTARALAAFQGTRHRPGISEEPGKILHEVRSPSHGESGPGLDAYYGTVDATPLWCMLVGSLHRWGPDDAEIVELMGPLRQALGWIRHRIEVGNGLLTYEGDETRLRNQGWKDSWDSMVNADGDPLANPIAVVEAQGYAVAALRAGADVEESLGSSSAARSLRAEADDLARRLDARFWRPDLGTFDMALGSTGAAGSVSSNPGHLLWAAAVAPGRATAVAEGLLNPDLWSGWGLRTLSRGHQRYHPLSYHRGSVWPHDTMMAISGLVRYGLIDYAHQLMAGLLDAAPTFSFQLPEVFAGFGRDETPQPIRYPTSSAPQAWAAAVPVAMVGALLGLDADAPRGVIELKPNAPNGVAIELTGIPIGDGLLSVRLHDGDLTVLERPGDLEIQIQ